MISISGDLQSDACSESEEISVKTRETKKKPKKLRSIRISRWSSLRTSLRRAKLNPDWPPTIHSSETDCSTPSETSISTSQSSSGAMEVKKKVAPNYFRPTSSSDARKPHFKASARKSESGKQQRPVRVLTKTISLKHQRPSSVSVNKATCSSSLKGAKMAGDGEIGLEGSGVSVKKVCPYSYCSLHGHKHNDSPPLKQFVSARRRVMKSEKKTKPDDRSPEKGKVLGSKKKKKSQMANNYEPAATNSGVEGKSKKASIAGDDEASIDLGKSEGNLQQIRCMDLEEEVVSKFDDVNNNLEEEDVDVSNLGNTGDNLEEGVGVSNLLEEDVVVSNLDNASNNEKDIVAPNLLEDDAVVSNPSNASNKSEEDVVSNLGNASNNSEEDVVSNLDNASDNSEEGIVVSNFGTASDNSEEGVVVCSLGNASNISEENDLVSNLLEEDAPVSNLGNASNNSEEGIVVSNLGNASNNSEEGVVVSKLLEEGIVSNLDNASNNEKDIVASNPGIASNNSEECFVVSNPGSASNNSEESVVVSNLNNASNNLEEDDVVSNPGNARNNSEEAVAVSNPGNVSNNLEEDDVVSNLNDARYILEEDDVESNLLEKDVAVSNHGNASTVIEEDTLVSNLLDKRVAVSNLHNASDNSEEYDLTAVTGEPLCESTPITSMAISASEEREEVSAAASEGFPNLMVSDRQSGADEEITTPLRKQNYSSLWNLIYRQMESDIAEKDGPVYEANKGKKEEDANTLLRMNSTGSRQGISRAGSDKFAEDQDSEDQEIQLNQTDAIKLVQEAINAILYPENRELSSDEQSVISDTSSTDLDKGRFGEADQQMSLKPEKNHVPCEEKGANKEMSKSKLMATKRWSNLKKVILMRRFVKALDRMREFNPRKPNYLPLEPDPESEKVSLRRQMTEERKNAEEFMLDYALRQVISKLAPAQKKKVELLVNAFETFIPPDKNETPRFRINRGNSTPIHHAHTWTDSSEQTVSATRKENLDGKSKTLHAQTSLDVSIKMHQDQVCDSLPLEQHSQAKVPEIKETTSEAELEATYTDQIVRVSLDDGESKFPSKAMETTSLVSSNEDQIEMSGSSTSGSTEINSAITTRSVLQTSKPTASFIITAEAKPADKVSTEFSSLEESDLDCSTDVTPETPKQNYTNLWFLLCKHMESGATETDETQPLDQTDKNDQVQDVQSDTSHPLHDLSEADRDMQREDNKDDQQKKKLQDEAVKLVQDAIDKILLPEVEDSFSDDQPISSGTPDKIKVSNSTVSNPSEALLISKNLNNQGEKASAEEGGKSSTRAPKNWSNLKKLILLRRFVGALEKVRTLKPKEPRFLPLEPNTEPEKLDLKHQDTDDRKNTEEWMLDYAIQQAITKLTPARKKKVQLLVAAFETVTPPTETESYMRRKPASSSRAHPFKSVLGH